MVKNKLEKMFSKSCRVETVLWFMKLHNNPLAHQTTPADYIISTAFGSDINHPLLYLVECKQVTCKEGKGKLAFKRLKQLHDMLSFENKFEHHKAFFCIAFYNGQWNESEVYLVPVKEMDHFIANHHLISVNRQDMYSYFKDELCSIKTGGLIEIWSNLQ